jgi:hypothetical protein
MLRLAIVFALLATFSAALAGCAKEETQMPDTVPPLPGKPNSMGSPSQPPPPPPLQKK